MDENIDVTYGARLAEVYDQWFDACEDGTVETLAELARGGPALELGIGTGRIALPLAAKGIEVCGIDAAPAMVAKLRARPGGESISVTMGNFADVGVDGKFPLIFIAFNTFYAMLTQEEQVRCFRNVAERLMDGGTFVVEAFVPDVARFYGGQNVRAYTVTNDRVQLQATRHDPVRQRMMTQNIAFTNQGAKLYPVEIRYVWPSEFDLMARLAGLQLRHRWSSWKREEFSSTSEKHISVYERKPRRGELE
jgi:SAM-dependent methyltransferase